MAKPTLRLGFTDYFENLDAFFIDWLSERFDVVRDDQNPQFLIFCDETFGTKNLSYDPKKTVKVFYTGENRRFQNYQCHAAITFDHYDLPFHYRLPLYVIDHWVMVKKLGMDSLEDMFKYWGGQQSYERATEDLKDLDIRGFCSFISGNPGNPHRNEFFQKLNNYKKVDAHGPLFNNVGSVLPRGPEAAKNKMSVLPKYKFNMCFENGSFPGYCTEKLFHAFYGKTVPIYAGSPTAGGVDFNPNAFLNWHDYLDDDKFLEAIIRIDQDDKLYKEMYLSPMFGEHNDAYLEPNKFFDSERFGSWFEKNVYPMKDRLS